MPDWSYHGIFQPILSKLPDHISREFIHRGMSLIASFPLGPHIINFLGREECSLRLQKEIQQIKFPNPIGLSGKIDPLLTGTKAFTNLGFGLIEIGPVSINPSIESSHPTLNMQENRIDFPDLPESVGLEQTIKKLSKIRKKQPLIIRLSGSEKDLPMLMETLHNFADGYILDPSYLHLNLQTTKPLFITLKSTNHIINLDLEKISGIVLEDEASECLLESVRYYKKEFPSLSIITSGGVHEPEEALLLLSEGADLILLSDGYVFSGPGLPKRINEAMLDRINHSQAHQNGWLPYWLFGLFIFLGGLLALFFSLTWVILPYDEHYLGINRELIVKFNERILQFMAHDRMTLAGTMISGGIVYMNLAFHGVKRGLRWSKQAIDIGAISGFLGIFLSIGYGYFDWLHLLFWLVLFPFYLYGYILTKGITGTPVSSNRKNHSIWLHSLYGQLAFVLLGFSFVLGGLVISYMGITSVFVPTDLLYLCMPQELLNQFNQNLIPVIAHDRAGFGSALFSVGLLVLTLSLWGFQQGNSWVWWTLLIGGLPAFIAGVYIHFAIGYTTFIHLLPAYTAMGLFIYGLWRTYNFFHKEIDT
ncbi:dihydroorotate dehydrogenase [Rossellomorea aquimaris]|uniref:dihydroorotate dehydrogenase n=1 Tax=Rossellomorea aquimaris TaxID=189382 RepID=UPI0007D0A3FD|nr:dihydroorotate dehydrogenase [Rossellomorea aquimaris]